MEKNTKKKTKKRIITSSLENTSLFRKFTILFIIMSVLPMGVLYYFYWEIKTRGSISLDASDFNLTLIFIVLGILLGYGTMRRILVQIVQLTEANRRVLERLLTPEKVKELSYLENEIALLSKAFSAITSRLEENLRSLRVAKKTLHNVMYKVGQGISNLGNIDTFLEMIVESVTEALNGRIGLLMLKNDEENKFCIKTIHGADIFKDDNICIDINEEPLLLEVVSKRTPLLLNEEKKYQGSSAICHLFRTPLLCTPLIFQEQLKGVFLVAGHIEKKEYNNEDLDLLCNLSSQVIVAIENARLNEDMEKTYFETISALALAVDAKDRYCRGHLARVADYCVQIGLKLNLSENEIKTLRDASQLHDLGKIGIPDEILNKEGPLNDEEWVQMRRHPEIGESIIKPIQSLNHLCSVIRHHHEKLDGTGYPDRLKGDQIGLLERIIGIADIFDALTTDRSYRRGMSRKEACQVLQGMGKQIDQKIVNLFVSAVEEEDRSNDG